MDVEWSGDYLSIIKASEYDYESVHERDMVLALPIVGGKYIIRKELCPAYTVKETEGTEKFWTMVSGTVDEGEAPLETIKREMGEETPVRPERIRIIDRREEIPFIKLSTQRTSIYHFRVLDYEETEAAGDGTPLESRSTYEFVTYEELQAIANEPNADFTIQFAAALANPSDI